MSSATRLAGVRNPAFVHHWDGLHYWLIFAVALPVYLAAAIGLRLRPRYWIRTAPRDGILVEAWTASDTTARIALFG